MVKISVIVPVYNREHLVVRCLDSILSQTEAPNEIIVIDNASTDSTFTVVQDWINRNKRNDLSFKLLSQPERGACQARQKGLENSEGEFVIFFDSDDVMNPTLIEKARKKILTNPSVDIVCWKCRIHHLDGSLQIPHFNSLKPVENHLYHTLLRPQGYIIRKEVIEKAGGWQKPLKVWNDLELGLRILLKNPELIDIKEVLAVIYSQDESITGRDFSSKEGEWEKSLEEMAKENELHDHPLKEKIGRILNYRLTVLAAQYRKEGNKKGAKKLLRSSLQDKSIKEKILLLFSYYAISHKVRGTWRIIAPFI